MRKCRGFRFRFVNTYKRFLYGGVRLRFVVDADFKTTIPSSNFRIGSING